MRHKKVKIIFILTLSVLLFCLLPNIILANGWDQSMQTTSIAGQDAKIKSALNLTIRIIQIIGITVAFISLFIFAIKFMSVAPSEKATVKKRLLVYLIGAVILFATTAILEFIRSFTDEII